MLRTPVTAQKFKHAGYNLCRELQALGACTKQTACALDKIQLGLQAQVGICHEKSSAEKKALTHFN